MNKKKFIIEVCNLIFHTNYNNIDDMPVEQYMFLDSMPYYQLIKPLVQRDKALGGPCSTARGLARKYGVSSQTAFNLSKV